MVKTSRAGDTDFIHVKKVKSLSRVQLSATPRTVAHQAPPSMEFSRQEYWSGLPFPSPGDLPYPGIKPRSPALQADRYANFIHTYSSLYAAVYIKNKKKSESNGSLKGLKYYHTHGKVKFLTRDEHFCIKVTVRHSPLLSIFHFGSEASLPSCCIYMILAFWNA